jgi:hypothetical protein
VSAEALVALIVLVLAAGKPLSLLGSVFVGVITVIFRWPMHTYRALGAVSTVWFVAAHPWLTLAIVTALLAALVAVLAAARRQRPLVQVGAWA